VRILVPSRRRRIRIGTLAVAVALVLTACSGQEDPNPTYTSTGAPGGNDPTPVAFPMPDTPVGHQAQWIIDQIAATAGPDTDEANEHLSAPLLAEGQPETFFAPARVAGPFQAVDLDVVGSEAVLRLRPMTPSRSPAPSASASASTANTVAPGDWRVVFSLDDDDRIGSLTIAADNGIPDPTTWAEVLEQLSRYDAEVGLFVARVSDDGRCEPVAAVESDRPMPVASTFKLWVLEAVARAVEAGTLTWSQRLTVDDDVRSLPSGRLQDESNGHRVSLSQTAAGMIALSDNTAADMLIREVGREAVEATMRDTGHSAPELNTPLLTTREFFTIGWSPDGALLDAWRNAGAAEDARRDVIADVPAGPLTVTADDIDDPVWRDGVDWFASAEDTCRIMAELHGRPADDPDADMLRTILGHQRGTDVDAATWPYVAYKGGTARGVLAASWFGERADGERYFVSLQAAAETSDAVRARGRFYELGTVAFELLSR
jgi:beta-lactamase class A